MSPGFARLGAAARARGLQDVAPARNMALPDGPAVGEAMRSALEAGDVLLVTGGLGPTSDDLTREEICEVLRLEMVEDAAVLDWLRELFARRGAREYMGEAVSMAQHMEQTAACAVADDAPESLVIAALLHDIGHFIGEHPIDALQLRVERQGRTVRKRVRGGP